MAIERVSGPRPLPLGTSDYQAQNDLLVAAFLYLQHPVPVIAGNIAKGAMFNIGCTIYQATSNTAITGTASAYVKLTPAVGGATAAAAYVADLTGVAWDDAFNGYYDGSGNLHIFDEALAIQAGALAAPYRKRIAARDENGYSWGTWRGSIDSDGSIHADGAIDSDSTIHADGAIDSTVVITAGGGIVAGTGNATYLKKEIEIGEWDMDSTASKNVAHGLSLAKIRKVSTIIRTDSDVALEHTPLDYQGTSGNQRADPTNVLLYRGAAGWFDNVSHDMTGGYNRGWIVIEYVP